MNKEEITAVGEKFMQLHRLHPNYTVLSITLGTDSRRGAYEQWAIYTPVIGHNSFTSPAGVAVFLDKIIADESGFYRNHKINEIKKNLEHYKEKIKGLEQELAIDQQEGR